MMEHINEIFVEIENCLTDYEHNVNTELLPQRIDELITYLHHALPVIPLERLALVDEVVNNLSTFKAIIIQYHNSDYMLPTDTPIVATHEFEVTERGRPKLKVSQETLLGLRNLGNSWASIARMLSVSRWTVYRRARQYGIQDVGMFSTLTDEELSEIIEHFIQHQSRLVGFPLVYGYLQSIGLHVQQLRVRNCLRRIDPTFNALRWATVIHRRVYNVRAPNSLWHIDGHHSLIKWGFVVHGSIDGFSRMITFLHCSTNNTSSTVLSLFEEAIETYGTPSRIRTDQGGENVLIWDLMENLRGVGRGSALRGSSTQNQRIERLWRDVFRCVSSTFYYLFQSMEDIGVLQTNKVLHMLILQYIFLPRINKSLELFANAWNNHPLRTAGSRSPNKIWQNGMLDLRNRNLNTVSSLDSSDDVVDDLEWYGYDPNVPERPYESLETNHVIVEDLLSEYENFQRYLTELINPLEESDSLGVDLYIQALDNCHQLIDQL